MSRIPTTAAALFVCASLSACHSAFIQTAIVNHSGSAVHLIEVDYPYASFGTQEIASETTYHYRFKVQGSGPVKITFTGTDNKVYTATGPALNEDQQGSLTITLGAEGNVIWTPAFSNSK